MRLKVKVCDGHLYVCRRRLHHGATGCLLALIGLALALHDIDDWPWPLTPEHLDY